MIKKSILLHTVFILLSVALISGCGPSNSSKAIDSATAKGIININETTQEVTTKVGNEELKALSCGWESIDPINSFVQKFDDSTKDIEVKQLKSYKGSYLIETKMGKKNEYTTRSTALIKLFNDEITGRRIKNSGVSLVNVKEGIILDTMVLRFNRATSETSSAYVIRRVSNLVENFGQNKNLQLMYFAYSGYTTDFNSAIITDTDSEWRGIVKIKYDGTMISTKLKAEGYLVVVFDKTTEYFGVQSYVKSNPTIGEWDSMFASAKSFKYKLN